MTTTTVTKLLRIPRVDHPRFDRPISYADLLRWHADAERDAADHCCPCGEYDASCREPGWPECRAVHNRELLLRKAVQETAQAYARDPDAPLPDWVRQLKRPMKRPACS